MAMYGRDILFSRMLGIVDAKDLDTLKNSTVSVPGCGGVGFTHAEALARMGIGNFKLADFDTFGPENINRQFGATAETFGLKKVKVLHDRLLSINPDIKIECFDSVSENTVEKFLEGVDFVCDALDYFVIQPRRLMYKLAYEKGIPVVMSGPIGFGATTHFFLPTGMTFDQYFDLNNDQTEQDMLINFGIGLNPGRLDRHYLPDDNLDFETRKVSSVSSSCLLATVQSSTTTVLTLLGRKVAIRPVPWVQQIDYVSGIFHKIDTEKGVVSIKKYPLKYYG